MLDPRFIRSNPDLVRTGLAKKRAAAFLDAYLALDESRRSKLHEVETARHHKNTLSEKVSRLKRAGLAADDLVAESREVDARMAQAQADLRAVEERLEQAALALPNLPDACVPEGSTPEENVEVRRWGTPRETGSARPHWDVGPPLGYDFERGVKLAGSGFVAYTGPAARLQRALINFMIDFHARRGYREIWPPYVANTANLTGTGQIPKLLDDMYRIEQEDLFLIPTAEVPITNLHREEILAADQLPIRYCGFSACFRKEAGAAGRDTRGLVRVHQFDKVELVKLVQPETSDAELESLVNDAEAVLQALEIPYKVLLLCGGDLSFAAAKCYDIEIYAPGVDRWLEISSCSNFRDFQARRANIRYRPGAGAKPEPIHTLNGSGTALPRLVVTILEHFQNPDGSISLPAVLHPYYGADTLVP